MKEKIVTLSSSALYVIIGSIVEILYRFCHILPHWVVIFYFICGISGVFMIFMFMAVKLMEDEEREEKEHDEKERKRKLQDTEQKAHEISKRPEDKA